MKELGIGILGGGYMGKAHAVAFTAVGAVFDTTLRPRLEMVCATSEASAERYRTAYGFARSTTDWRALVDDPRVDAVVIATPQDTHMAMAHAALAAGKPVLCEKPLADTLENARAMAEAARKVGVVAMCGYNYIRTPATQEAKRLIDAGALGPLTWFRAEHTEDFLADPGAPSNWRTKDRANGCLGDLAPHVIHNALHLMGPIKELSGMLETVHHQRPGPDGMEPVTNDDQVQVMCRFENGVQGHLFSSRTATGRKMGYAYEVCGPDGALRFDQEDQNSLWHYKAQGAEGGRGFTRVLAGPEHPDYLPFCQGPGHGTGYQDQIIIEAAHFLAAIAENRPAQPSFEDGLAVARVAEAIRLSDAARGWVSLSDPRLGAVPLDDTALAATFT